MDFYAWHPWHQSAVNWLVRADKIFLGTSYKFFGKVLHMLSGWFIYCIHLWCHATQ